MSIDALILAFNKDIAVEIAEKILSLEKKSFFEPSKFQKALIDFVLSGTGNGLVQAVAGSGKTTTILQALNELRLKYQTQPKEIKKIGSYKKLDYGGFSIYPSTQHALAFGILAKSYPNLKSDRSLIDPFLVSGMVNQYFKTGGKFFRQNTNHSNYTDNEVLEHLERLFPPRPILIKGKQKMQGGKPVFKYPHLDEYKKLNQLSKKTCKKLVGAMLSAGVGLFPHLPISIDTARKIYYDYSLESMYIKGVNFEKKNPNTGKKELVARHYEMEVNPNTGNHKSINVEYIYDLFQKDRIAEIATEIMQKLYDRNDLNTQSIDFDLMIYKVVQDHEDKLMYPEYDFVFQDEAQDTNSITQEFLSRLVKRNDDGSPIGRIIGVGDVAQAIYGFRGANSYAMQDFEKRFNCTLLPLSTCYRCASSILEAVRNVGALYSSIQPTDDAPLGLVTSFPQSVSSLLDKEITVLDRDEGGEPKLDRYNKPITIRAVNPFYVGKQFFNEDTAIISRTNGQLKAIAQVLRRKGVPINLILSTDEGDVDDVEGDNSSDYLVKAFIENLVQKLFDYQKGIKVGRKKLGFKANQDPDNPNQYNSLNWFMVVYKQDIRKSIWFYEQGQRTEDELQKEIEMYDLTVDIMKDVMAKMGQHPFDQLASNPRQQIKPFYRIIYDALVMEESGGVTLVSAHKSKGLEYPRVILLKDTFMSKAGLLPRHADIQASWVQEMNMFYVGMTRAEKELILVGKESDAEGEEARFLARISGDLPQFPEYDPTFEPTLDAKVDEVLMFVKDPRLETKLVNLVKSKGSAIGTIQNVSGYDVDPMDDDRYKLAINVQTFLPFADFPTKPVVTIRLNDGAVRFEEGEGLKFKDLEQMIQQIKNAM